MKITAVSVALLAGIVGCSCGHGSVSSRVLFTRENIKYHLICTFYGEQMTINNDATANIVKYIIVRSQQSGRESRFKPIDASSLEESEGFFADVWSPDQEFLLLPLGRFEGFAIIRSADALQHLSDNHFDDIVRVQLKSGVRLWHEFRRWEGASSFAFSAGLSGQQTGFIYAIPARVLTAQPGLSDSFIGINLQGTLHIQVQR